MKAILLAAGRGTRISRKVERVPKSTLPVDGVPLIRRSVELLQSAGMQCVVCTGFEEKKVILYHAKERFFNGSTYEYFSLKRMGLSKDAVEIQFENADESLCEMVMDGIMH